MASRNIYVSADAEQLFDEAASLASSLSAAVETGLRLFVESRRQSDLGFSLVRVDLENRSIEFYGRLLASAKADREHGRILTDFVYLTPKGQLAVTTNSKPDFAGVAEANERGELWSEASDEAWWEPKDTRFEVHASFDDLQAANIIPAALVQTARDIASHPRVERLDI